MDDSQYYCGESSGWNYKGGPVLSKSKILADSAEAMVEIRVSSCLIFACLIHQLVAQMAMFEFAREIHYCCYVQIL